LTSPDTKNFEVEFEDINMLIVSLNIAPNTADSLILIPNFINIQKKKEKKENEMKLLCELDMGAGRFSISFLGIFTFILLILGELEFELGRLGKFTLRGDPGELESGSCNLLLRDLLF